MALDLEQRENLIYLIPGVHQKDIKSMFYNAVLGFTNDGVVVYNDQLPDNSTAGTYYYKIRAKLDYSDVILLLIENVKGVKKLLFNKKITFVCEDQEKSLVFFISKKGEKYFKKALKEIKTRKIKIEKRVLKFEK